MKLEAFTYSIFAVPLIVYTQFGPALDRITRADPGPVEGFIGDLQQKLDEKLENGDSISPDAPALQDIIESNQ